MRIRVCLTNLDLYLPDTVADLSNLKEYIRTCGIGTSSTKMSIDAVKCFGHCYPCNLGLCAEIDGIPTLLNNNSSSKQHEE